MSELPTPDQLEVRLRRVGAERYHHLHPFHHLLHTGKLNKPQVQAWALNRYYYQSQIPRKDAAVLGQMDDAALRREWRERIIDHDGDAEGEGGILRWLKLATGLGLDADYVRSTKGILPGTRFAVDAYVNFCRSKPLLEAVASSLTEMFSPDIIGQRVAGMLQHYDFVSPEILAYFNKRPVQAKRDSDFALDYVKTHARTVADQQAVIAALEFKCGVLWSQLDALHFAYVEPGHVPPGAWKPEA
ncbi:pyrroloquinoline-quinone synthase PqqC [Oceanibaculum pacificum]|uniref:Pyrroloquinoline-quinone synthase n=1 Tax=Oceanibaculum pacificum TaxID=580166 RepID=A0A154WEQ1_9PROT|nr:pyrroloquinoline-quinone synthase PqqC [Oceanibaculum pacificum]KZD11969.1 pyrroloquinoline quinone biosynthesis protein C [Oceanibaculum pacificum]